MTTDNLTSVELFAGGGGMALGTRAAGFQHLALVEWNKNAAAILRHNAKKTPTLWKADDVQEIDVRSWLLTADQPDHDVDLVAGGPPCQPFSLAGIHAGDTDERNMFPAAIEAVRKFHPKYVLFENVPGLTRPSFAPYFTYIKHQIEKPTVAPKDDELWIDHDARVRSAQTEDLRYVVHEHVLEAADFGLPQNRRRVFLIAIRADVSGAEDWSVPNATHDRDALLYDQWVSGDYWTQHEKSMPESPDGMGPRILALKEQGRSELDRWQTVRDCISQLPDPVDRTPSDEFANHEGIPGARAYAKHSGSPIDWPAKTIKAGVHGVSGGEAMVRLDDDSLRYFTVRESARMQGFCDTYEFPVARSRSMGAIGNAVAVPLAESLTKSLLGLESGTPGPEQELLTCP